MASSEVEDEVGTSGRGVESTASGAGEEMSPDPDSLKNTPSNIARLEDVIEQCSGRQKYLARTKSPSDGEDVRWYFCKVPFAENELAASVPRTEIVGKGEYFRFGMRDSLALEAAFLRREEDLLKYWWTEYAECSDGPSGSLKHTASCKNVISTSSKANQETGDGTIDEERVGVPVKGGLYEVDLERRHCFPVYWNGENRRVLRGHWFARKNGLDWFPLREDVAEQLEFAYRCQVWHRRTFQPSGLFAARVDLQGTTQGIHALFTGEDDTWEAWLGVDNSGISQVISGGLKGVKLRRGFSTSGSAKPSQDELRQQKEEEMDDYCSQVPVRHLVFMVHGIGQRLEKANLVDDVGDFRHITASLAERHLTSYQRSIQRVLFIPCQWRRCLKFSGETAVEKCTLDGVRGLRVMLGATAHDILYYMSPIYCQDIIDSVSNQLNRLYLKFIKRNPGYDGKVSIYGHSLGSVLSYDILCHQSHPSSRLSFNSMYANHGQVKGHQVDEASDCKNIVPEVGHVEEDSSCSMSNLKEDLSGDHQPQCVGEEPDLSLTDSSESSQLVNAKLPPREVLGSDPQPCEARKDLNFHMNFEDRASDDKDQLIAKLKLEVHFLNAKIAELESRKKSSIEGGDEVINTGPNEQRKSYTPYIKYTKLEFEVDTFFSVGSPLAVFLALRNIRIGIGRGQDYWEDENITEEMPACKQMYNIFHPFDPVAYRVEPLVCKEYISKRPVIVPYHKGGKRLHIGFQEFTEDLALRSQAFVSQLNSVKVKMASIFQKSQNKMIETTEGAYSVDGRTYGSFMMQVLTGSEDGRVDHVLQDKTFQHPYISAIGSHTNYWRDPDTALLILNHLYRYIPEEPDSPGVSDGRRNKRNNNNNVGLLCQTDPLDEDLPLTFSDEQLIRSFSRKVRKAMSKT